MKMKRKDHEFETILQILKEELIPAMGCTEPIAVAYAAASARDALGKMPDRVEAKISSSIIKNVKSVIVPNTSNLKGIAASIAAGIVAGDASQKLEVIANTKPEQQKEIENYMKAFAAAVVGGLDSVFGSIVGGWTVGISESLAAQYIGSNVRDPMAFVVLIVILLIKPNGFFGKKKVTKI